MAVCGRALEGCEAGGGASNDGKGRNKGWKDERGRAQVGTGKRTLQVGRVAEEELREMGKGTHVVGLIIE